MIRTFKTPGNVASNSSARAIGSTLPAIADASSIGRAGGWRGVTHPGDRAQALALVHCLATDPAAPRTVVGVPVERIADTTRVRIDAIHEYATRGAIKVIACESSLRLRA